MDPHIEIPPRRAYEKALRRGRWRNLRRRIGHKCNDLIPTRRVLENIDLETARDRGVQEVPLEKIVGSTGRFHDFDLDFHPLHHEGDDRWVNIASLVAQKRKMPPVKLYKVGEAYFVEDGNHRVSVARSRGDLTIQAHVIELATSGLSPKESCSRLGYKLPEPPERSRMTGDGDR